MICEMCHKVKASVFLTEVINGHKVEMHLCQNCASKEKTRMYSEDSFQQFLSGLLKLTGSETKQMEATTLCPKCKMTVDEFKQKSKLGCEQCYHVFKPMVKHIVKSVHGGSVHSGKKPKRLAGEAIHLEKIVELNSNLNLAIMSEDYEEAARIRDILSELKEDTYE